MLGFETWKALYQSDLQSVWAVVLVPLLFLVWLSRSGGPARTGIDPDATAFLARYAWIFAALTILDPIVTGPLVRLLGLDGWAATAVMLCFVLLGDWRVYLLLFAVRDGPVPFATVAWRAARWALVVPAFAWPLSQVLFATAPGLPGQVLWLVYEAAFAALALVLRQGLVSDQELAGRPGTRSFLRDVLAYIAVYYGLWALSDALILGAGIDAGWALRTLPNQLYYAFWVPFVYFRFFSVRYASRSRVVHAVR